MNYLVSGPSSRAQSLRSAKTSLEQTRNAAWVQDTHTKEPNSSGAPGLLSTDHLKSKVMGSTPELLPVWAAKER